MQSPKLINSKHSSTKTIFWFYSLPCVSHVRAMSGRVIFTSSALSHHPSLQHAHVHWAFTLSRGSSYLWSGR